MKSGTRWGWGVALLAMAGMGLLLSFMLPLLQQGPLDIDRHFLWLFWVNVLVAMALAGTLVFIVGRIWLRMRRGFLAPNCCSNSPAFLPWWGCCQGR
jgi:hypothetical protein